MIPRLDSSMINSGDVALKEASQDLFDIACAKDASVATTWSFMVVPINKM
jgi:hypothetical protein